MFHDIGLIERWGNGVRLMIEECKTKGSKPPEFAIDRQGIKVKFFNMLNDVPTSMTFIKELNKTESMVLNSTLWDLPVIP